MAQRRYTFNTKNFELNNVVLTLFARREDCYIPPTADGPPPYRKLESITGNIKTATFMLTNGAVTLDGPTPHLDYAKQTIEEVIGEKLEVF